MALWRAGEGRRLGLSFLYFATLLASYYLIRPVRDALAAGSGPATIKYLSSVVFVVMLALVPLFGVLVTRVKRSLLLPATQGFFALNLVCFAILFHQLPEQLWVGRVFYVWTTAFNLAVVSIFWSFMADIWQEAQGRRLFGVIAAGGSLGGLIGPLAARAWTATIGITGIALLAALGLCLSVAITMLLARDERTPRVQASDSTPAPARTLSLNEPLGGEILAGLSLLARSPFMLGIACLVFVGAMLGMFVYIELAKSAASLFATTALRTTFFATRDLWVNGASCLLQAFVVGALASRIGVRSTMLVAATVVCAGFAFVALTPTAVALLWVNGVFRATEFSIGKPTRDMLWTVVSPEAKYKVKNVIETVVYRGADVVGGWAHAAFGALGFTLTAIASTSAAMALALVMVAWSVGRRYRQMGGF